MSNSPTRSATLRCDDPFVALASTALALYAASSGCKAGPATRTPALRMFATVSRAWDLCVHWTDGKIWFSERGGRFRRYCTPPTVFNHARPERIDGSQTG